MLGPGDLCEVGAEWLRFLEADQKWSCSLAAAPAVARGVVRILS